MSCCVAAVLSAHSRPMRIVLGIALLGLVLVGAGSFAAPDAEAGSCYRVYAKADGSGSSYRHFVYVENNCDYWLRCRVWTDENPSPPKLLLHRCAPRSTQ